MLNTKELEKLRETVPNIDQRHVELSLALAQLSRRTERLEEEIVNNMPRSVIDMELKLIQESLEAIKVMY